VGGVDDPGLVGVQVVAERERALPGHVLRAERPRDAVVVEVPAALRVVVREVGGHDAVRQQEVGVPHRVQGVVGNVVRGVAGQRQFRAVSLDDDAVADQRRVVDRHEGHLEARGLEGLQRRDGPGVDGVEVVVLRRDGVRD